MTIRFYDGPEKCYKPMEEIFARTKELYQEDGIDTGDFDVRVVLDNNAPVLGTYLNGWTTMVLPEKRPAKYCRNILSTAVHEASHMLFQSYICMTKAPPEHKYTFDHSKTFAGEIQNLKELPLTFYEHILYTKEEATGFSADYKRYILTEGLDENIAIAMAERLTGVKRRYTGLQKCWYAINDVDIEAFTPEQFVNTSFPELIDMGVDILLTKKSF